VNSISPRPAVSACSTAPAVLIALHEWLRAAIARDTDPWAVLQLYRTFDLLARSRTIDRRIFFSLCAGTLTCPNSCRQAIN